MPDIKVLGPGCTKCYAVERAAAAAMETLLNEQPDLEATLEHIEGAAPQTGVSLAIGKRYW